MSGSANTFLKTRLSPCPYWAPPQGGSSLFTKSALQQIRHLTHPPPSLPPSIRPSLHPFLSVIFLPLSLSHPSLIFLFVPFYRYSCCSSTVLSLLDSLPLFLSKLRVLFSSRFRARPCDGIRRDKSLTVV